MAEVGRLPSITSQRCCPLGHLCRRVFCLRRCGLLQRSNSLVILCPSFRITQDLLRSSQLKELSWVPTCGLESARRDWTTSVSKTSSKQGTLKTTFCQGQGSWRADCGLPLSGCETRDLLRKAFSMSLLVMSSDAFKAQQLVIALDNRL
jgi:hypothetical protein